MAAPQTAQICITLANKTVWVDPPNFVSLEMERIAGDTCNSFKLQILDTSAFDLEYALLNNTGGNISFSYSDYSGKEFKKFSGYVLKLSSSFYDNRNMLTVDGFVGVSFKDKFDKISFAWNVVPKFDWSKVFFDYDTYYGASTTSDMGLLDYIIYGIKSTFGTARAGYLMLGDELFGNGQAKYNAISDNPEGSAIQVINHIKVDSAGNFYVPNLNYASSNYNETGLATATKVNVKQSGSYIVPMRPDKIVKFIGRGGQYSELLEKELENYKGTSFYNGENKVTKMDWAFIQQWYKKLGSFAGCGWKVYDQNIEETDMKEVDFTQTKQSFLEYINKVLMPNSTKTSRVYGNTHYSGGSVGLFEGKVNNYIATVDDALNGKITEEIRTNFMLSFDNDGTVHYKRINITNKPTVVETYYVYGDSRKSINATSSNDANEKDIKKSEHGVMTSFSAELDVLTSLITQQIVAGNGDISNINLITGEQNADYQTTADPTDELQLSPFSEWGKMKISVSIGAVSADTTGDGKYSLAQIEKKASTMCYRAHATIEGPCLLNPQDYIYITVLPRLNAGSDGMGVEYGSSSSYTKGVAFHHTTGNYYIQKITEHIEGGRQYANLELFKNVGSLGNTGTTTVTRKV